MGVAKFSDFISVNLHHLGEIPVSSQMKSWLQTCWTVSCARDRATYMDLLHLITNTAWKFQNGSKFGSNRYPIRSMYAIYGNIYHQYTPNVSIYTIHGSYGYGAHPFRNGTMISREAHSFGPSGLPDTEDKTPLSRLTPCRVASRRCWCATCYSAEKRPCMRQMSWYENMGMSENGVYPSKTIGFFGVHHFQTNPYADVWLP